MSDWKQAVERLNDLADQHHRCADAIENGEINLENATEERIKDMVSHQRFMGNCCGMAAYILNHDNPEPPK